MIIENNYVDTDKLSRLKLNGKPVSKDVLNILDRKLHSGLTDSENVQVLMRYLKVDKMTAEKIYNQIVGGDTANGKYLKHLRAASFIRSDTFEDLIPDYEAKQRNYKQWRRNLPTEFDKVLEYALSADSEKEFIKRFLSKMPNYDEDLLRGQVKKYFNELEEQRGDIVAKGITNSRINKRFRNRR